MCSMRCPYCQSDTKVTNSRSRAKGAQVWRRRECTNCHSIWTTHEVIDPSTSHRVKDSHNRLQPFSRDKLFVSLLDALRHRKTALADATALTDTVLARVLALKSAEITKQELTEIAHQTIKTFDSTAAAVYQASTAPSPLSKRV